MMNVNNLKIGEVINYFKHLTLNDFVYNIDDIYKLDIGKFKLFFFNVDDKIKKYILDDDILFERVLEIPGNKNGKLIFELVNDDIRNYIIFNDKLKNSNTGKELLIKYLDKLDCNKFSLFCDKYDVDKKIFEISVKDELLKYNASSYIRSLIRNSKDFNPMFLLKINNIYQLFIYSKFNILVNVFGYDKYIYFEDGSYIEYDFLIKINKKHVCNLLKLLKDKDSNCGNKELFIGIIKLYSLFGYDNSKKIIEDYFTYSTVKSVKRASLELFKDQRRDFRLKNQKKFYYYGMEKDVLKALKERDNSIFRSICLKDDDKYINKFIKQLYKKLIKADFLIERQRLVKETIVSEIKKRENYYQEKDVLKYKKYYNEIARNRPLSGLEIYKMFKDIKINVILNDKGQVILNDNLIKFLLGNCRRDNDCLLRMVINKQAMGLNTELFNIINNFNTINDFVSKNNNLSLYSLLDVIDISKVLLYDLKPDELDITLSTLSKILSSRTYLEDSSDNIVSKVLELHKIRKKKFWSTIPKIKWCIGEIKYELADFDDESLLTSGIDGDDCLKIGGAGEEFLTFCLTSPNGGIMFLYYNNVKYILPCSRNGNMININSIDPEINDRATYNIIIMALIKISNLWTKDINNGIDIVTITDMHISEFMKDSKLERIAFDKYIPLGTNIYSDYNKVDVNNYVLSKSRDNICINYDKVNERFYQPRTMPYIYTLNSDYDKERFSITINNIAYSNIDYLYDNEIERKFYKDNYINIDVNDYLYIIGNKDWFIAINRNKEILYHVLPYDYRALEEFNNYFNNLEAIINRKSKFSKKKKMIGD